MRIRIQKIFCRICILNRSDPNQVWISWFTIEHKYVFAQSYTKSFNISNILSFLTILLMKCRKNKVKGNFYRSDPYLFLFLDPDPSFIFEDPFRSFLTDPDPVFLMRLIRNRTPAPGSGYVIFWQSLELIWTKAKIFFIDYFDMLLEQ